MICANASSMTTETPPLMPEITQVKRIVLEHKTGRFAGLSQITGTSDNAPNPLPTLCEGINRPLDGDHITASLTRQKRGAVYYTELVMPQGLGRFDRSQR